MGLHSDRKVVINDVRSVTQIITNKEAFFIFRFHFTFIVLFHGDVRQVIDKKLVSVALFDHISKLALLLVAEDFMACNLMATALTNEVAVGALVEPVIDAYALIIDFAISLVLVFVLEFGRVVNMTLQAVAPVEAVEVIWNKANDAGP